MNTITITIENLVNLLLSLTEYNVEGKEKSQVNFIGVIYTGIQRIFNKGRGKNSMLNTLEINPDDMTKTSHASFDANYPYETGLNNKRAKIGLPAIKTNPLGCHYKRQSLLLVEHVNGTQYLTMFDNSPNKRKATYDYNGTNIDVTDKKFDAFRKPPKKQKHETNNVGVLVEVPEQPIRFFKLTGISQITINKQTYKVIA